MSDRSTNNGDHGETVDESGARRERSEREHDARVEQARQACDDHAQSRMPDIDFSTFVLSLSSSALMHLGEMPNAETQETDVNLPMAKQTIDILGIVQEKTRGNLSNEEDRLLTELLYDLRLKFVRACKQSH